VIRTDISREDIIKIRKQAIELTNQMWIKLKPYIEKENKINRALTGKPLTENEIREELRPEWTALIDKNFNLVSPRYGFDSSYMVISKPIKVTSPKPYSIGYIHYHPINKLEPSVRDIMSWIARYTVGEYLFCIHTDEKTRCYTFKNIEDKKTFEDLLYSSSFQIAVLFGVSDKEKNKIKNWFNRMIEDGKIKIIEAGR